MLISCHHFVIVCYREGCQIHSISHFTVFILDVALMPLRQDSKGRTKSFLHILTHEDNFLLLATYVVKSPSGTRLGLQANQNALLPSRRSGNLQARFRPKFREDSGEIPTKS
ncbi:hypothetical protein HanIR_Chr02g0083681 [Helianthus annuus]|nr:hypothetical protein HanIR_Chr02g0083681 [Helianthus annuus]